MDAGLTFNIYFLVLTGCWPEPVTVDQRAIEHYIRTGFRVIHQVNNYIYYTMMYNDDI